MEARNFNLSEKAYLKVINHVLNLGFGVTIVKKRSLHESPHQIKLTIREWRTFQEHLPTLLEGALKMHREITHGITPILRENKYIISSQLLSMLGLYKSPTQGTLAMVSLCPYEEKDGNVVAHHHRGVVLSFDELMGLSEQLVNINKYLATQLSSTKFVTLKEPADVIMVQAFIQEFWDEGKDRVRLMLEKPRLNGVDKVNGEVNAGSTVVNSDPKASTAPAALATEMPPNQTEDNTTLPPIQNMDLDDDDEGIGLVTDAQIDNKDS